MTTHRLLVASLHAANGDANTLLSFVSFSNPESPASITHICTCSPVNFSVEPLVTVNVIRTSPGHRPRYIGEAKTHLQHLASAAAMNTDRVCDWLMEKRRAGTRQSAYERLMAPPAPN